jgi:microcystin-dependent protein
MIEVFGSRPDPDPDTVALWAGAIADIPTGWVLCDGNNGTPDMLDKFPMGTASASDTPGTVVGEHSKTLATSQLPSHDHTGSTDNSGAHNHSFRIRFPGKPGTGPDTVDENSNSTNTTEQSSHSHSQNASDAGSDISIENRPQFEEVAFIMKT